MTEIRAHTLARVAYDCVAKRADEPDGPDTKVYGSLAHKLPGMILQNGLAQATGFLIAKGNREHTALLDDLNDILRQTKVVDTASGAQLHERIIRATVPDTLELTRHALDASAWVKRYVQGKLRVSSTGDSRNERATGATDR